MHRNEKHWLTEEELESGTWGESLEDAVVEIMNLLPLLKFAFSGIEIAAAAIRAKELGFDRSEAFWPTVFPKEECHGMAWRDDPDRVAGIEPPPDLSAGWKLDPYYGDRIRYWNGEEWDLVAAPAAGNLELFKRIASGEEVGEVPETVTIHPANSMEPNPLVEMIARKSPEETRAEKPATRGSAWETNEEVSPADRRRAEGIARYIAEQAFAFDDHEARAWALTDFEVWAGLAGESAQLSFESTESDGPEARSCPTDQNR